MSVLIEGLQKAYGSHRVLRSVSETFEDSRISVLLGPSGCGKTTTLRCIAGLERPAAGRIVVGGHTVYQDTPPLWVRPERRRLSMVFQSYAIWPHMSVFENVSVPLRAAGVDRAGIRRAVAEALQLVGLADYAERPATNLSGGQQQRVALARCIVADSPVILMDEPLSNLDAKLRVSMRAEIRALQRRLGRTVLFVTHDQEEAMSIADTVYLYREGQVIQRGSPREMYDNPATRYAAEFLGRANIFEHFERVATAPGPRFALPGGVSLPAAMTDPEPGALLCIRPEKWRLTRPDEPGAIAAEIADMNFVGDRVEYTVDTTAGRISVTELGGVDRRIGDRVGLQVSAQDIKLILQ